MFEILNNILNDNGDSGKGGDWWLSTASRHATTPARKRWQTILSSTLHGVAGRGGESGGLAVWSFQAGGPKIDVRRRIQRIDRCALTKRGAKLKMRETLDEQLYHTYSHHLRSG